MVIITNMSPFGEPSAEAVVLSADASMRAQRYAVGDAGIEPI